MLLLKKMNMDTHREAEFIQSGTLVVSPTEKLVANVPPGCEKYGGWAIPMVLGSQGVGSSIVYQLSKASWNRP